MEVVVKAYKITNKHKNRIREKKVLTKWKMEKQQKKGIKRRTSTLPCERLKYE